MNRACTLGDLGHGRMGTEQSVDSRTLALLDEPPEIQEMLSRGNISPGHVSALHTIENESERTALAKQAADKYWSVEETEKRARRAGTGGRSRIGELAHERSSLWEVLRHVTDILRTVTMLQRGRIAGGFENDSLPLVTPCRGFDHALRRVGARRRLVRPAGLSRPRAH